MTVLHSSVQARGTLEPEPASSPLREEGRGDSRTRRDPKAPQGTRNSHEVQSDHLIPPWSANDAHNELTRYLARQLAENVAPGAPDACWEWTAARDAARYGRFRFAGKSVSAHRIALEFVIGRPLATGELALHRCDNPPCCNPTHLYVGTHQENREDAAERFRGVANSPNPTPTQRRILQFICDCRARFGYPPSIREIGAAFGIASTNGVNDHLKALERKGLIAPRNFQTARALVPTETGLSLVKPPETMPSLVKAVSHV